MNYSDLSLSSITNSSSRGLRIGLKFLNIETKGKNWGFPNRFRLVEL